MTVVETGRKRVSVEIVTTAEVLQAELRESRSINQRKLGVRGKEEEDGDDS